MPRYCLENSDSFLKIVQDSYKSNPKYDEIRPGLPENYKDIRTIGDLLRNNYKSLSVQQQLRQNLILKLKNSTFPYTGIIGYDDDIVPSLNRAILSGHDILIIGQIGQAKTKIAETIAKNLLSPIPVVRGTITHDIPTSIPESELISLLRDEEVSRTLPEFSVSTECEDIIRNYKLDTKIEWLDGNQRFKYILATPDISVKDLVGQIDAIKVVKKGIEIYNIDSYSPGQLLQARHGILCIDELPVLDPRKQVALLSVLQEGKFTTGSFPVIFRPNTLIVCTANPIDYTHAGKIIEPLHDRLKSHVVTHYPKDILDEMTIMVQESNILDHNGIFIPVFILQAIAEISRIAREHQEINHDKGVSVRMSIHSTEVIVSESERTRSIRYNVSAIPRFSDIYSIHQTAKFELSEIDDIYENRTRVLDSMIAESLKKVSTSYLSDIPPEEIIQVRNNFTNKERFLVSQKFLWNAVDTNESYQTQIAEFPSLRRILDLVTTRVIREQEKFEKNVRKHGVESKCIALDKKLDPELYASILELVLEGLRSMQSTFLERRDGFYAAIK